MFIKLEVESVLGIVTRNSVMLVTVSLLKLQMAQMGKWLK